MQFKEILSRFEKPKRIKTAAGCNQTYQTICPCHDDSDPSLTISEAFDGKTLFKCHAECDTERILERVGLTMRDICSGAEKTSKWKDRIEWYYANKYVWNDDKKNEHKGYGERVQVTAEYPYYDENSNYLFSKVRIEGGLIPRKLIRYYTIDHNADTAKSCKKEGLPRSLYRLPEFLKMKNKARWVYIVEGEKDCETLRKLKNGFGCVVTAGSTSDWKKDFARLFKGLDVIIFQDNDEPGKEGAERIKNDLKPFAHFVKIITPSKLDHGDVTDYLTKEGGTAESLKELCNSVTDGYFASWVKTDDSGRECGVNTGILAETISENETYIIIRNSTDDKDTFFFYEKGVYKQANRNYVKSVILDYVPAAKATDNMLNNTYGMLLAINKNIHSIEELNSAEQYINLKNGLYDLTQKKLISHTPEVLSTIQFPFDYDPEKSNCRVFERFMNDLCKKQDGSIDYDEIKLIQEYIGFLLSNEYMSKIKTVLILYSALGNTGKSTLLRLISKFFGMDRIASIRLLDLTAANKFILGNLPGCRIIMCGDESNSTITESGIFKSLTGGDPVKVEPKGKQGFSYVYKGGFVIACNGLPYFEDDKGDHLYNRLLIAPCEHYISDDKKDASLDKKLEHEIPAIFNWALEGLFRLIDNGFVFTKSESSEKAKREYHSAKDNLYRFIIKNYEITRQFHDRISKTDFNDAYHEWCMAEGNIKEVDRRNIPEKLKGFGISEGMGNVGDKRNIYVYRGIIEKESDFINTEEADKEVPFD